MTSSSVQEGSFFKTFPTEVRLKIYRELLTSRLLAQYTLPVSDFAIQPNLPALNWGQFHQDSEDHSAEQEQDQGPQNQEGGAQRRKFIRYGLSPVVLQLCKQINEEATPILYEENTFFLVCFDPRLDVCDSDERQFGFHCPLTRYLRPILSRFAALESPLFARIRKWVMVLYAGTIEEISDSRGVPSSLGRSRESRNLEFMISRICRLFTSCPYNSPLTSLQFHIMPWGYEVSGDLKKQLVLSTEVIKNALAPLGLLRKVGKMEFSDAEWTLPTQFITLIQNYASTRISNIHFFQPPANPNIVIGQGASNIIASGAVVFPAQIATNTTSNPASSSVTSLSLLPDADFLDGIRKLAMKDENISYVWMMYPPLIAYAQAFERYGPLRNEMAMGHRTAHGDPHIEDEYTDIERIIRDELGEPDKLESEHPVTSYVKKGLWNPYRPKDHIHPLESMLISIGEIVEDWARNKVETFVEQREQIVKYLEPQYLEIMEARAEVEKFILAEELRVFRQEIGAGSGLERSGFGLNKLKEVIMPLRRYEQSFWRHRTPVVASEISDYKQLFKSYYINMPREKFMNQLDSALERRSRGDYWKLVTELYADMNKQADEIRAAKERLTQFDVQIERVGEEKENGNVLGGQVVEDDGADVDAADGDISDIDGADGTLSDLEEGDCEEDGEDEAEN